MLLELAIKNFAIIDEISLSLGPGLNIFTGETGAGKSIIVSAVNLLLAGRAPSDLIKSGTEEATIEALFDISRGIETKKKLESLGFETKGDELVIRRVISRTGKSRIYINGALATVSTLEHLGKGLIDILSQHEHQTLLDEEIHTDILDELGGHRIVRGEVYELYSKWSRLKKEIEEAENTNAERIKKEEFLRFQCEEIDRANLEPGEDGRLEEERKRILNSEKLFTCSEEAYEILYEGEGAVIDKLKHIQNRLDEVSKIDPSLVDAAKSIERAFFELKEAALMLRGYASRVRFDPERLSAVETRLEEIRKLKRKYGQTIEDILSWRERMERELEEISNYEEKVEHLKGELDKVAPKLIERAYELSTKRKAASEKLSAAIEKELGEVGMKNSRLSVEFEEKPISGRGLERASFLFSANPDEKLKPLSRVVSGGELSRVMLVLKEVLARVEGGTVLVFDEADSGIGGAVAEAVGRKIKNLSTGYQVICITHLPQIAKFADTHFRVLKTFKHGRTQVEVDVLDKEEKVKELGRMMGGLKITEKTIEAAREMLKFK